MEQIRRMLEKVDGTHLTAENHPQHKHAKGEEVLGVANTEVMRAYSAYADALREARDEQAKNLPRLRKLNRTPASRLSADDEALAQENNLRVKRVNLLGEMMYHTLYEQFPMAIGHKVGVRQNWLVVLIPDDDEADHCEGCGGCSDEIKHIASAIGLPTALVGAVMSLGHPDMLGGVPKGRPNRGDGN